MKTLIAITDSDLKRHFFPESVRQLLASFTEVDWLEDLGGDAEAALAENLIHYDACLTSWGSPGFTRELLDQADKLKYVGHIAGSVVSLLDESVFDRGVTVSCANPLLALSTAEGAVAMIMAGAWELKRFSGKLQQGEWSNNNRDTVTGLSGQTIGIIGYGEISRNVIRMLSGFPVTIKLASRYCTQEQAESLGVQLCSLQELLSSCRIISIHSTLTPSSRGMLGREELALIQDGALLVNTARAEIFDEAALLAELQTGRFSAVLDVYHQEPLPSGHPLLQFENVLCLPHIAGFSVTRKQHMGQFVAEDLQRFIRGEQPLGRITPAEYSRQSRH